MKVDRGPLSVSFKKLVPEDERNPAVILENGREGSTKQLLSFDVLFGVVEKRMDINNLGASDEPLFSTNLIQSFLIWKCFALLCFAFSTLAK